MHHPEDSGPGHALPRIASTALAWSNLTRAMFYTLIFAFLAFRYESVHGIPPATIQWLVALVAFAGVSRPALAALSDHVPIAGTRRKSYAIAGHAAFVVATILLVHVVPGEAGWFPLLATGLGIYAAGESVKDIAYDSYILDVATTPAIKTHGRAVMRIGAALGTLVFYLAGAFLVTDGWAWLLLLLLASNVVGLVLACLLPDKKVSRATLAAMFASRPRPDRDEGRSYTRFFLLVGFVIALGFVAEGLANVLLEPWVIGTLGAVPAHFYLVEVLGAVVAIAAIMLLLRACKNKDRLVLFIIPGTIVSAAFYVGIVFLMPDLVTYLWWNTAKFAAALLLPMIVDRILMDVVKGYRKGEMFQYFIVFSICGASIGGLVGAFLAPLITVEGVLLLAAATWLVTGMLFAILLLPRVARLQRR